MAIQLSLHNCLIESKEELVYEGRMQACLAKLDIGPIGNCPLEVLVRVSLFGKWTVIGNAELVILVRRVASF